MSTFEAAELASMALRVRERVIRLATAGGCFLGAALSCVDLLVYLYVHFLSISRESLDDPERDYFLLSKGHAVPALYATFVELGWLPADRLANHLQVHDDLYWHPNRSIPGVEFHAGSLGHLLPVAAGIALDCQMRGQANRVLVLVGDGELNEGSTWETCLVAAAHGLDNLVVVVDRNAFQANVPTETLIPLEPLQEKFEAFGCRTLRVDGHDLQALHQAFASLPVTTGRPSVVIVDTVRGRGLPSIEARADRWFCDLPPAEVEQLVAELHLSSQGHSGNKHPQLPGQPDRSKP